MFAQLSRRQHSVFLRGRMGDSGNEMNMGPMTLHHTAHFRMPASACTVETQHEPRQERLGLWGDPVQLRLALSQRYNLHRIGKARVLRMDNTR